MTQYPCEACQGLIPELRRTKCVGCSKYFCDNHIDDHKCEVKSMNISEEDFNWLLEALYSTHYNNKRYNEILDKFHKQKKRLDDLP